MKATKKSGASPSSPSGIERRAASHKAASEHAELELLKESFRTKSEQLRLLAEVVRTANSMLEPEALTAFIVERVQVLVQSEAWSLLMLDESGRAPRLHRGPGQSEAAQGSAPQSGRRIAGTVAQTGRPHAPQRGHKSPLFNPQVDRMTGSRPAPCSAFLSGAGARPLGVLEMMNKHGGSGFTEADLETTYMFAEMVGIALENAFTLQKIKLLSLVDDLTQLYNSRYLHQALGVEITRAKRFDYPLSVIFLDLDGFKSVNDSYGHLAGSQTLTVVRSDPQATGA